MDLFDDWTWDDDIIDFAVNTFDTFVYDTGYGSDPFFSLGGDASGSIWQDGWDYIDNIWGDSPDSGRALSDIQDLSDIQEWYGQDSYSWNQMSKDAQDKVINQYNSIHQGSKGGGLLGGLSKSFKKSAKNYVDSGKIWEHGAQGLIGAAKWKMAQKEREKQRKWSEREAEKSRKSNEEQQRLASLGFLGSRGGFAR